MIKYRPPTWLDLSSELDGLQVHRLSIGYDNQIYILATPQKLKYRRDNGGVIIRTDKPHDYLIFKIDEQRQISTIDIPNQKMMFHHVQPLPDDELLLASSRAGFRSAYNFDLNVHVFSVDSDLQRKFCIGDAAYHLQTTSKGEIWTGYGDEASFGRFGWGDDDDIPVAIPHLIQWDKFGKRLYSYDESLIGKPFIDCYAMNVENDDTLWFYYYADYRLVCLQNGKLDFWRSPFTRVGLIAISSDYVMYYHKRMFKICRLRTNGSIQSIQSKIYKVSPRFDYVDVRADTVVFLKNSQLYRFTIANLLE